MTIEKIFSRRFFWAQPHMHISSYNHLEIIDWQIKNKEISILQIITKVELNHKGEL